MKKKLRVILTCVTVCLLVTTSGFDSDPYEDPSLDFNTLYENITPHYFVEKAKKKVPVYLRIDKYYILFAKPKGPYLNEHGRLMVPLKMLDDLMGEKVTHTDGENQGTVGILNATIRFTVGSDTIDVNGEGKNISAKPTLVAGKMMIPLKSALDNTDIEYKYDAKYNQIHITDIRAKGEKFFSNLEVDRYVSPDENAIKILYYIPSVGTDEEKEYNQYKLEIYGRNMTPNPIDKKSGEVRVFEIYKQNFKGSISYETDDSGNYTKPGTPYSALNSYETKKLIQISRRSVNEEYIFMTARLNPFLNSRR